MVNPLVFTNPGNKLMALELEDFFSFSIALAPAEWLLDTFDGRTVIEAPWPCCSNWNDLAIACIEKEIETKGRIKNNAPIRKGP